LPSPEPVVDLRGLFPPEPMVRILEAIGDGGDGPFVFRLALEPRPLYPMLERGGWSYIARRDSGGVELTIRRKP